jgi:tetratricopeptide (TPR) repeat protein
MQAGELLALTAGAALPATMVHEIRRRGLNFHPDEAYQAQLKQAGADETVLAALRTAKVIVANADGKPDKELLQHLTSAAVLMRDKHYNNAVEEIDAALKDSFASPETGFVMGELLRRQEQWSEAAQVYSEVLRVDPGFPAAHTKLSYIFYRLGDSERALREAKTALAQNSEDAEAHKNAGLALDNAQRFDDAVSEYKDALRIKPDYTAVHFDLGLLFYHMHNYDSAIAEYKKAIALDPNYAGVHRNLGIAYQEHGDIDSAIREGREGKRLDSNDPYVRQNLASALMLHNAPAAIPELRELVKMFPDFEPAHEMLGRCFIAIGDVKGAQEEFHKAVELDPSDAGPHSDLGKIQENVKNYDAALEEYRQSEELYPSSAWTHADMGRILAVKNDFASAIAELKQAEALAPSDSLIHEIYGDALQASGNNDLAITQFKETVALNPKQFTAGTKLAAALEKKGDWVGAIEQYRRAALAEADSNRLILGGISRSPITDAQKAYKAAQARFEEHLAALSGGGKSAEAAQLKKRVDVMKASPAVEEKAQLAIQTANKAFKERRYEEAEKSYKEVVAVAEHLAPGNENLIEALGRLGNTYGMRQDYKDAETTYHRQLAVIEKQFGPESPRVTVPLASLGGLAAWLNDDVSAENYFSRALEINLKAFGENSFATSESLRALAGLCMKEKKHDKAESYLVRAVKANEVMGEPDGNEVLIPLWGLCDLYDTWNKPEQSQPCWHRATGILEKQFSEQSPNLVPSLTKEAQALRRLGQGGEAAQLEKRAKAIGEMAAKPN